MSRAHHPQHDDRLIDVFTEAEAFAWAADVACLGAPQFCFDEGMPDLVVPGVARVEAKTIHYGDTEKAARNVMLQAAESEGFAVRAASDMRPLHETALKKLADGIANAAVKFARTTGADEHIVYVEVEGFDLGTQHRGTWEMESYGLRCAQAAHVGLVLVQGRRGFRRPRLVYLPD